MNSKTIENINKNFGKAPKRTYSSEELEKISFYAKNELPKNKVIDDITWNDLDMNGVYKLINNTPSSVGDEYVYAALRTPTNNIDLLNKRSDLSDCFANDKESVLKAFDSLSGIGKNKKNKTSVFEYISKIFELKKQNNLIHFILIILLILSVVSLFLIPGISILLLLAMIFINVISYYKIKAKIDIYFNCFKYTVVLLKCAKKLLKSNISFLSEYNEKIEDILKALKGVTRGSFLVASSNVNISAADVLMDYVRMLFHVDLIKFNYAQKCISENTDKIKDLYNTIGEIELILAISSFRSYLSPYCKANFARKSCKINFKNIYHPLIENPVKNSLENEEKMLLLTGSNASGKSTFLRTVAINAILAQTVYTCSADEFNMPFSHVFSSMALSDNLSNNESYYIVEIKSIKRILDALSRNLNVICFVDEVLRGTNTIERIAASSKILKYMNKDNCICFAATHDIELTQILSGVYDNYHFEEEVTEGDVKFNYNLKKGPATSRNAIKLLEVMGYENNIVKEAEELAKQFEECGRWS